MNSQLALSLFILFCSIVMVVCFVIIFRRRNNITRTFEAELLQRDLEIKAFRESTYVLRVAMNKEAEGCIQLIQARTQAESPEEVLCDAADLYMYLVKRYSEGYRMFLWKPFSKITVKWDTLERVQKKIES